MTSAFLSDDEQKKAANAIAKNNVKNLLSAANDANLGATLGIGTLDTSNTTKWITDLLKAGVGIDGMISAFSDVGQGTLFKSLFEALSELKITTDSLAGATQKLTEASKAQLAITLDEWLQKNKLSGLSNLSDFDKNREFMQQINSTYSSALRGNEKAGNSLTGLIDEYLSFAQKYNPADFAEVSAWARSLVSKLMESIKPDGSHYSGLNSVPYDGYIAELHKDERVLTASESLSYDKLMIGLSNQSSKQTIEVKINQDKNDNAEQIAILIKSMQVMQEGHKQTIAELKKTNAELAELKASARRREVKA
jgi:hypothetical protein